MHINKTNKWQNEANINYTRSLTENISRVIVIGAYSEASLRQTKFKYLHHQRYIRIHLVQRPPNINNGQGHCVMTRVYVKANLKLGKAAIKCSPQTDCIS
ncbi:succinate dehydrogenase, flavoprotein subunit [Trichinella spiralis]|uniref:succinate dehydrogenase, flavoprotein subunit n=1 Tax=Trichinella spiralis TaxID=6334 RepID=UPI0001EFC5CB|nr:succinate dehydrogenase, flavoprotein subunit [Trichinella spiralis]